MKKNRSNSAPAERRHASTSKSSPLPHDYLEMVEEVFTNHFETGLKAYQEIRPKSEFSATGAVFADEVVLAVSLVTEGHLAATTLYASADFDPKASAPTAQDLLAACIDALGSVWDSLLNSENPETLKNLADESLSALEEAPFDWTSVDSNQRKIWVKIDKSNPWIDQMAEDWLKKHDPEFTKSTEEEQAETEKLFVTGPSQLQIQKKNTEKTKKN